MAHTYSVPVPDNLGGGNALAASVDVNGDGNLDLVLNSESKYTWSVIVLLGNGDGTFGPAQSSRGIGLGLVTGITAADLNGDHKPDVIVVAESFSGQGATFVMLSNGDGTFAPPVKYFAGASDGNVVAADFNNDGKLDDAVGTSNGIAFLIGNGDGTFQPATFIPSNLSANYSRWLSTGNWNLDGNPDLIASGTTEFQVLLADGHGNFNGLPPSQRFDEWSFLTCRLQW